MSRFCLPLAAAALALGTCAASANELIRIEPRPYYGAVVSIEQGVRVFRPLPPQSLMIINPGSKTPINLSFNRTIEQRVVERADSGRPAAADDGSSNYNGASAYYGTNPTQTYNNQGFGKGQGGKVRGQGGQNPFRRNQH